MARKSPATLLLMIACISYSCPARANSLDKAIEIYLEGYAACQQAKDLRTTNLDKAEQAFDQYLRLIRQAESIDEAVLKTSRLNIDDKLAACRQVAANLKRARATPVLEQGFEHCRLASSALSHNDILSARQHIKQYRQYHDTALAITDTILDIHSLAKKVADCKQAENRVAEKSKSESALVDQFDTAIQQYQQALKQCLQAQKTISAETFDFSDLDNVNQQLIEVAKVKKIARQNAVPFDALDARPEHPKSQELQQVINRTTRCEGRTANVVRQAIKSQRELKQTISEGCTGLSRSLDLCTSAQLLSDQFAEASKLEQATTLFKQSTELKQTIVEDTSLIRHVRNYSQWEESQNFIALLRSTSNCQKVVAETIQSAQ